MNWSMRQLKAFVLVARLRHFTRAAERLHLTQAGLSLAIRELEQQAGERLFERTTRSVELTPAGERLLPAATAALEGLEAAAAEIGSLSERARRTLRVAATPHVSSTLLPGVMAAFRDARPEVTVRLVDTDLPRVAALVENGDADLGLGFFFRAPRGLERKLLREFPLVRVGPARGRPRGERLPAIPWSALGEATLLALPPDNPIQQLVDAQLARLRRRDDDRLVFNQFATLIAMAEAGLGEAVVPSLALPPTLPHRVEVRPLARPRVAAGFHGVTRRGRAAAPLIDAFVDALAERLARYG